MAQLPLDSHWAIASQLTLSALATPAPKAIGATAIAPATAAIPNMLRKFFNIFPFAERAPDPCHHFPDNSVEGRAVSVLAQQRVLRHC
jgi:hypothetical protein